MPRRGASRRREDAAPFEIATTSLRHTIAASASPPKKATFNVDEIISSSPRHGASQYLDSLSPLIHSEHRMQRKERWQVTLHAHPIHQAPSFRDGQTHGDGLFRGAKRSDIISGTDS